MGPKIQFEPYHNRIYLIIEHMQRLDRGRPPREAPDMQGFSVTNLKYCRLFYEYLAISPQAGDELGLAIGPQAGDQLESSTEVSLSQAIRQIPWGHIKLLLGKIKNHREAGFYIQQTLENGWSRDVLALQIKSNLTEVLPESIKGSLPTVEEIEAEIQGMEPAP